MARLSVVVICYNEEEIIEKCLNSVKWADEIIVVDSYSTDQTMKIAKGYTDRIYQHEWQGYGRQKNLALSYASHPWVLSLDADEVLSAELIEEIRTLLIKDGKCKGYRLPRMTYYLGRLLRYCWYPDYKLRLFQKDCARWSEQEVHEEIILNGSAAKLKNPLFHYSFPTIADHIQTIQRYTALGSEMLVRTERPFPWHRLLGSPVVMFVKLYIIKRGFLDGFPGLIACALSAVHEFVKYAKMYELQKKNR